jgi:cell fate regulator YaaT (PSP1 superfamily)
MTDSMIKLAGVRFRDNWKVYDFDATNVEVAVGDQVIVDSDRGPGFALVVRIRRNAPAAEELKPLPVLAPGELETEPMEGEEQPPVDASSSKGQASRTLRKVLRKATDDDRVREEKNRAREKEAFSTAQDMITERELPMKLIRVEYSFDASRATFFFFSETRVDFRELVKDLAYKLKNRIEMRQIGVRDVARMIGGFGPCGRELCCSSFLKNFEPVSIRMAKKQDMVLNPAKISGVCGRLLCCLSYEYGMYDEIKKDVVAMRDAAGKEKREEEARRVTEEQRATEERRLAEEKRRQEERRPQQEPRRDRQKESGQKSGGRPDKRRDQTQEKKAQPSAESQRERREQPKKEKPQPQVQQPQAQKPQPQQATQDGEQAGKKKRRRFWRKKKRGPGETPNPPKAE